MKKTKNSTQVIVVLSEAKQKELHDLLESEIEEEKEIPYARWSITVDGCRINAYNSGKTQIQGPDLTLALAALNHMGVDVPKTSETKPKPKAKTSSQEKLFSREQLLGDSDPDDPGLEVPQAGSDETGCGDFFGPVCVSAVIVPDRKTLERLEELGVTDSKAMSDDYIRKIAPEVMELVPYSLQVLPASKYNEVHQKHNLNAIKAILHNNAYLILRKKGYDLPDLKVVDQFAPEKSYYNYLKDEKNVEHDLTFETRAESHYPAVAAASVITRYAFLQSMDKLSQTAGFSLPKGAGRAVDKAAARVARELGWLSLASITKNHFSNLAKTELELRAQGVQNWKMPEDLKNRWV